MITVINKTKILTEHISCECKCKGLMEENVTQIKNGITKNVDVSAKNQKEHHV